LDAITIVYEIEDLFEIEVANEQLENLQSVRDIVDGITKLVQAKG
jgi:acyl carrier protein